MDKWNGFVAKLEEFHGRELITVFPENSNGKWVLKTEYLNAFPAVEIELLKMGYHLFHIKTRTSFHMEEDTEIRAKLAEYVPEKYGLSNKCVVIGLSCGGMQGIYFASEYPQYVSCLYLDAPVVNLLSYPGAIGKSVNTDMKAYEKVKGMDIIKLMSYRNHPLDRIPDLVQNRIPIVLVSGDSDTIVPFDENGMLIKEAYESAGLPIKTIIKKDGDHHPHGLDDCAPIIELIKKYDID